ncbi:acyl-CoA dehydrogenase family protein [Lysinibacillus sp. LZ02]|uniref:acyl-CoA dehydrogenase family protein n=1 Tax=Lysinibacillus sp. LZ02 TaxID=3420668 RepID=UPI003D35DB97
MSVYHLTEEHVLFQQSIKKWVDQQLTPKSKEMETNRAVDESLISSLQSLGFLTATLPESLGGLNADVTWNVLLLEEIAKAGATGFAQIIKQHAAMSLPLLTIYLKQQLLVSQCLEQNDYCTYAKKRSNQHKLLVVNGQNARYLIVHDIDHHQLSLYDTNTLQVTPVDDLVGWHTANIAHIDLQGNALHSVQLAAQESFHIQATNDLLDAAIFYGIAQIAYEQTKNYTQTRIQFDGPLTQFQVVRHQLVDMKIEVDKLRHFLYVAAFNNNQPHFITQSFALRLFVEREVPTITDWAVQFHGGNGFMMEYDPQRFWRDSQMYVVLNREYSYSASEIGKIIHLSHATIH